MPRMRVTLDFPLNALYVERKVLGTTAITDRGLEESFAGLEELLPRHSAGIRDEDRRRILQVGWLRVVEFSQLRRWPLREREAVKTGISAS